MQKWTWIALSAMVTSVAWAEDASQQPVTWDSDAELGIIITNGNSSTRNVNAKLSLINERPHWRHQGRAEGLKTSDKHTTTAEKYLLNGKTSYKFTPHNYVYLLLNYEDDRFSGYEYQASESVGYGHRSVSGNTVVLDTELGVGARQSRLDDTGKNTDETTARVAAMLEWKISATSVFREEASYEAGEDNTISRSVTSLKSRVSENLSMKLSFTARRNSEVPPGVRNSDTESVVTLVYNLL